MLVEKLSRQPGLMMWLPWEDEPAKAVLETQTSASLREQREQLDSWWDRLYLDRDYLIEHRDGRLCKEYVHKVESASRPAFHAATNGPDLRRAPGMRVAVSALRDRSVFRPISAPVAAVSAITP